MLAICLSVSSCSYFTSGKAKQKASDRSTNQGKQSKLLESKPGQKNDRVTSPEDNTKAKPSVRESVATPVLKEKQRSDKFYSKDDPQIEPFQKHDHAKYAERVNNAAIDLVNKAPEAGFARVCRDSITEQWTLHLYYFRDKKYWFISYNWDEIDEKWEDSFKSDKRPLNVWKDHVNFSASGKECRVLKGALRLK